MLMSFLGCIGYIMDGNGLLEALGKIYVANSVDKMLDGHAYSRSIRSHTILRLALSMIIFEDMKMEDCGLDDDTPPSYIFSQKTSLFALPRDRRNKAG